MQTLKNLIDLQKAADGGMVYGGEGQQKCKKCFFKIAQKCAHRPNHCHIRCALHEENKI